MANYVLKRIFQGLISILGATAIIFAISRLDDPTLLMLPIDATPDHICLLYTSDAADDW